MRHHRVQITALQQRVDGLPVALPVGQRARFDLRIVEVAFVDVVVAVVVLVIMVVIVAVIMGFVVMRLVFGVIRKGGQGCGGKRGRGQSGKKCGVDAGHHGLHSGR